MNISTLVQSQKQFFSTQQTKDISFRKHALKKLQKELIRRENDIIKALYDDFKKSEYEAVMTETSIVLAELKMMLKEYTFLEQTKTYLTFFIKFSLFRKNI